jgi:hypothetical protein
MAEQVPLGIVHAAVPSGSHIWTFFSGPAQRDDVVAPFLAEGIRSVHECVCVLEAPGPLDLLARLGGLVDAGHFVEAGQPELPAPADAYLRSGRFSTEDMLEYWRDVASVTQEAAPFSLIRAAGEMPAVRDHPDGRAEFFRYESLLTAAISAHPEVVICPFDLERFGAEVLMDALTTHPRAIVDGMIHDNPCYVEPGMFLAARG